MDLNQIALGSETGELGLYDLRMIKQAPIFVQKIHDRLVRDLSFNKSLNIISSASEDCTSKVFRIVPPSVTNEAGIQNMYNLKLFYILFYFTNNLFNFKFLFKIHLQA